TYGGRSKILARIHKTGTSGKYILFITVGNALQDLDKVRFSGIVPLGDDQTAAGKGPSPNGKRVVRSPGTDAVLYKFGQKPGVPKAVPICDKTITVPLDHGPWGWRPVTLRGDQGGRGQGVQPMGVGQGPCRYVIGQGIGELGIGLEQHLDQGALGL